MAGEVFAFCVPRPGEMFDQVAETFPKFGKNKMRMVTQPWKVLQGLEKTPATLSSSRARFVRDAVEQRDRGGGSTLTLLLAYLRYCYLCLASRDTR